MTSQALARRHLLGGAGAAAALSGLFVLLVRGDLTIDLAIGRTFRPLGPLTWRIEAAPEVVFDVISTPYLERTPRALESKLRVLEWGSDMVLAEHFTPVVGGLIARTLETVRFERPHRVSFRLVRGPVPHVVEQFLLRERDTGTELEYSGELGADLWALGRWWGELVARRWEAAVRSSLDAVKAEAERRAARPQAGEAPPSPSASFPS